MKEQTAQSLSDALEAREEARVALIMAPDGQKAEKAEDYVRAHLVAITAKALAARELDLAMAGTSTPGAEQLPEDSLPPLEASPNVVLVQPPQHVLMPSNIGRYGVLGFFRGRGSTDSEIITATPYAFAPGTAVLTAEGERAIEEPSRIVIGGTEENRVLAVVTEDTFNGLYEKADPKPEAVEPEQPDDSGSPADPED